MNVKLDEHLIKYTKFVNNLYKSEEFFEEIYEGYGYVLFNPSKNLKKKFTLKDIIKEYSNNSNFGIIPNSALHEFENNKIYTINDFEPEILELLNSNKLMNALNDWNEDILQYQIINLLCIIDEQINDYIILRNNIKLTIPKELYIFCDKFNITEFNSNIHLGFISQHSDSFDQLYDFQDYLPIFHNKYDNGILGINCNKESEDYGKFAHLDYAVEDTIVYKLSIKCKDFIEDLDKLISETKNIGLCNILSKLYKMSNITST